MNLRLKTVPLFLRKIRYIIRKTRSKTEIPVWICPLFISNWLWGDVEQPVTGVLPTGYGLKKFVTRDKTQYPIGYNTRSDQDWVHFRYAEILLAIAEAENEVNGPTQKAYDAINSIRARKGVDMPPLPTGLKSDTDARKDTS